MTQKHTLLCAKYKLMGLKKNEPVNPHTATLVVNFWVFLFALFGINTDSFLSFLFSSFAKKE